jgi:hypothetical protein
MYVHGVLGAMGLGLIFSAGCGNTSSSTGNPLGWQQGYQDGGHPGSGWPDSGSGNQLPPNNNPWLSNGDGGAPVYLSPDGGSGGALPDSVCNVLKTNGCTSCHTDPTMGGAPMSLATRNDFAVNAKDGTPLAQKILARVQDANNPMPPQSTGRSMMSATDLATLKSWIDSGMPGVAGNSCTGTTTVVPDESNPPWTMLGWPKDEKTACDWVMTIGAHGTSGTPLAQDSTGFPIPTDTTHYECFYEQVPWGNTEVQAIAVRARLEQPADQELVHHFVVSSILPGTQSVAGSGFSASPGAHAQCDNPSGSTIGIYAPGAVNPLSYPSDVGVQLPSGSGAYIELQIHYNNPSNEFGKSSRAQYDICVTKTKRANTAGVFWLGYENAFAGTLITGQETTPLDNQGNGVAIGKCGAKTDGHILAIMPHMHQHGVHSKMEIVKQDNTVQTVLDAPFNFMDQTQHFHSNLTVKKGDVVRTTCKWDTSPIYFGFGSSSEMCFIYTLAYPLEVFKPGTIGLQSEKGFVAGDLECAGASGP